MIRTTENDGLALALIQIDGGTQSRATLNQHVVDDYAEAIQAGATFPPIVVFYDGKKHWLADGFHRFHAYQKAGREKVAADVRQGTRRDAILHSVGANETHGLRRTRDDKRRAVETLLNDAEWGKWTDREIARRCAVSPQTVANVRGDTVQNGQSDERTYVHPKTGKPTTMKTAGINASRTQFQAKASVDNGSITGGAGAVTGEASRLASGRTDAGEVASVDLPTISDAIVRAWMHGYLIGFGSSAEGWNSEYPFGDMDQPPENDQRWLDKRLRAFDANRLTISILTMEQGDVDRSAERASSAVEVGATNSPDGATRRLDDLGSVQDGLKMSTDGQPKTGLSTDCIERPIEVGVTAGETASNSQSAVPTAEPEDVTPPQAPSSGTFSAGPHSSAVSGGEPGIPSSDDGGAKMGGCANSNPGQTGEEPARISTQSEHAAAQFNNPRCQKPATCHLVHSRNECFDFTMAWAKRPKDEQIRLWAEAIQAARVA